jgi:hypothetical protein
MAPVFKLILTVEAGERTLAIAPRLVHHVTAMLASDCAPLLDAFPTAFESLSPRWMSLPQLFYAQVIKSSRRRRIVVAQHRGVCSARGRRVAPGQAAVEDQHLEAIAARGALKRWQSRTPATAAGLTNRMWSLRDVLVLHVPPWPQPCDAGRGDVDARNPQPRHSACKAPRRAA